MRRLFPPLLLGLLLVLSACGPAAEKPTASAPPTPAPTASQSAEPTPSATPLPTVTPAPAAPPVWGNLVSEFSQENPDQPEVTLVTGLFTLPRIENADESPAYKAINRFYDVLAEGLKGDTMANISLAKDDYSTAVALGDPFTAYSDEETYEVKHQTADTVVILRTHYGYTGGPYPTLLYMADRFDLETGAFLTFADFFPAADKAETFVRGEVTRQAAEHTEYDQPAVATAFNRENFYLTDQGVVFFYQPQALAPHAAALPEFLVPYDLLEGLLSR